MSEIPCVLHDKTVKYYDKPQIFYWGDHNTQNPMELYDVTITEDDVRVIFVEDNLSSYQTFIFDTAINFNDFTIDMINKINKGLSTRDKIYFYSKFDIPLKKVAYKDMQYLNVNHINHLNFHMHHDNSHSKYAHQYCILYLHENERPKFVTSFESGLGEKPFNANEISKMNIRDMMNVNLHECYDHDVERNYMYGHNFSDLSTLPDSYFYDGVLYKKFVINSDVTYFMTKYKVLCQIVRFTM